MSDTKRTGKIVEVRGVGPCEVCHGTYESNGAPALILMQVDAPHRPLIATYNVSELKLRGAVVIDPAYSYLVPELVKHDILMPGSSSTVQEHIKIANVENVDMTANALAAPVICLAHPAELDAKSAAPRKPDAGKVKIEIAPKPEPKGEEKPKDEKDKMPRFEQIKQLAELVDKLNIAEDTVFLLGLTLKPGQTFKDAAAEKNAEDPAFTARTDPGIISTAVDTEAAEYLNALAGKVDDPHAFIGIRGMLRGYQDAKYELDSAYLRLVLKLAKHLPSAEFEKAVEMLRRLDRGMTVGLYRYVESFAIGGKHPDMLENLRRMNEEGSKVREDFLKAMEETGGDFQAAMMKCAMSSLPANIPLAMIKRLVDKLGKLKGGDET